MYERKRRAIDLVGHTVELIERQDSDFVEAPDGGMKYFAPPKLYGQDGEQLIDEGHDFYRTPLGVRYKLID